MAALAVPRFSRRLKPVFPSLLAAFALIASAICATAAAQEDGEGCRLNSAGSAIRHIVHIQFDNVHFRRDNPNVPSDLEQMPNLLNFLEDNGVLLNNHHTPLISHTADDIITTLTGVYGDKHGQPVANSYGYFRPDGSVGFSSSFGYWTDTAPDGKPQMIDQSGKTHPAPWVPFTRAGCDFGAFSTANIEFENVGSDINNVFGSASWEAAEAASNFDQAVADFEGIAIHCARHSPICAESGQADKLPDEPGGYLGFDALFGNYFVAPRINHGQPSVNDIDGHVIDDGNGHVGFPGFDPSASQTLGYVATMLEAGVPVVYAYIADAHDNHFTFSGSYGPGETGYVQQLAAYNEAFGKFFARLSSDGITKDNTLFIITADENDHFAGQAGAPAGCDGIHTPCTYIRLPAGCDGDSVACTTTNLGEVGADLRALLLTEYPATTPPAFSVHSDSAPNVYVLGQPGPTAASTRALEHHMGALQGFDPIVSRNVPVMAAMADPAEMALLHMVTSDPARTPTFTLFGNPDFYLTASSKATACASLAACSNQQPGFNWNHGDFQEDITRTWLGIVGPGVRPLGVSDQPFSDHTDIRPTLLALAGLTDDYAHDGRVLFEVLQSSALPNSAQQHRETLLRLADAYKAIDAPRGSLGRASLSVSTRAVASDDATYGAYVSSLTALTQQRNAIAASMIQMLEGAAFGNQPIDEGRAQSLTEAAEQLLRSVSSD
ncbi:MAG TPA: hypothetical protein VGY49_01730 [Burkholderiaceae bacterium]|jgi:hypothetical protein|nr:hypothetical protein [Burkholderiaceae bacterium]